MCGGGAESQLKSQKRVGWILKPFFALAYENLHFINLPRIIYARSFREMVLLTFMSMVMVRW